MSSALLSLFLYTALYLAGDGKHYLNIGLVNGSVYICTYKDDQQDGLVTYPAGQGPKLNDDLWHSITITREAVKV